MSSGMYITGASKGKSNNTGTQEHPLNIHLCGLHASNPADVSTQGDRLFSKHVVQSTHVSVSATGGEFLNKDSEIAGGDAFDNIEEVISSQVSLSSKISLPRFVQVKDIALIGEWIFGIPRENLHCRIIHSTGDVFGTYTLAYAALLNNSPGQGEHEVIDIMDIVNKPAPGESIGGLPIDYQLYASREAFTYLPAANHAVDLLSIMSIEYFAFSTVVDRNGAGWTELVNFVADRDSLEVFYHGFLEKYFPMIPLDAAKSLFHSGDIYQAYPHLQDRSKIDNLVEQYRIISTNTPKQHTEFTSMAVFMQVIPRMSSDVMLRVFDAMRVGEVKSTGQPTLRTDDEMVSGSVDVIRVNCWAGDHSRGFVKFSSDDYAQREYAKELRHMSSQYSRDVNHVEIVFRGVSDDRKLGLQVSSVILTASKVFYVLSLPVSDGVSAFYNELESKCQTIMQAFAKTAGTSTIALPTRTNTLLHGISQEIRFDAKAEWASMYSLMRGAFTAVDMRMMGSDTVNAKAWFLPESSLASMVDFAGMGVASVGRNEFHTGCVDTAVLRKEIFARWSVVGKRWQGLFTKSEQADAIDWARVSRTPFIELIANTTKVIIRFPIMSPSEVQFYKEVAARTMSHYSIPASAEIIPANASRLKILKDNDPVLFKPPGNDFYSRKCQGDRQPIIVQKGTKGSLAYWNFTRNEPEYYACNSKTHKYVKFLTGLHPKGYCIPCCKKKNVDLSGVRSKYVDKHKKCLDSVRSNAPTGTENPTGDTSEKETNMLEDAAVSPTDNGNEGSSRYVVKYSNKTQLESNRLQYCGSVISKLLKVPTSASLTADDDTGIHGSSISKEALARMEYMYLGVPQTFFTLKAPILTCIAVAMQVSNSDLIDILMQYCLKNKPTAKTIWDMVQSTLPNVQSIEDFFAALERLASNHTSTLVLGSMVLPFTGNELTLAILTILEHMDLYVLEFEEQSHGDESSGVSEDVDLRSQATPVSAIPSNNSNVIMVSTRYVSEGNSVKTYSYPIIRLDVRTYFKSSNYDSIYRLKDLADVCALVRQTPTHPLNLNAVLGMYTNTHPVSKAKGKQPWVISKFLTDDNGNVYSVETIRKGSVARGGVERVMVGVVPQRISTSLLASNTWTTNREQMRQPLSAEKSPATWSALKNWLADYSEYLQHSAIASTQQIALPSIDSVFVQPSTSRNVDSVIVSGAIVSGIMFDVLDHAAMKAKDLRDGNMYIYNSPVSFSELSKMKDKASPLDKVNIDLLYYKENRFKLIMGTVLDYLGTVKDIATRRAVIKTIDNKISSGSRSSALMFLKSNYPEIYESITIHSTVKKISLWREQVVNTINSEYYMMDAMYVNGLIDDPALCAGVVNEAIDKMVTTQALAVNALSKESDAVWRESVCTSTDSTDKLIHCDKGKLIMSQLDVDKFKSLAVSDLTNKFMRKQILRHIKSKDYLDTWKAYRFAIVQGEQIYAY